MKTKTQKVKKSSKITQKPKKVARQIKLETKHFPVPDVSIERVLFDTKTGRVTAIDCHNESDGCAYFFSDPSVHFHGFNNK